MKIDPFPGTLTKQPLRNNSMAYVLTDEQREWFCKWFPEEENSRLMKVSDLSIFAREGIEFSVQRSEGVIVRTLDNFPRPSGLFGDHILISEAKAMEKEECERKAHRNVPVPLSPREQKIVERLGTKSK